MLFRFSTVPAGTTIEEAERIVSQPGWKAGIPPLIPAAQAAQAGMVNDNPKNPVTLW